MIECCDKPEGRRPYIVSNTVWVTTVAFQQMFMDLEVRNYLERYQPEYDRRLKVDVVLDTKERIQHKLMAGGHHALEQSDTRLPRISIQINNIAPDLKRYNGKNTKRTLKTKVGGQEYDVQPYPVNIEFSVGIWCKYFEHYTQIIENILPWFDPYATVGVKERNYNIERELRVKLDSVSDSSTFELEGGAARIVKGDMNFIVETFAYKPIECIDKGIIYEINVPVVDIITPMSSETVSISADQGDELL